ncbi:hypothetical protein KCU71_g171, partial [Aureobasidium melanogenum]
MTQAHNPARQRHRAGERLNEKVDLRMSHDNDGSRNRQWETIVRSDRLRRCACERDSSTSQAQGRLNSN